LLVLALAAGPEVFQTPAAPFDSAQGRPFDFAQGRPGQASLDSVVLAARDVPRLHSLLVSHQGSLVLERYLNGRRATQHANVKSVSKSVISALVGIAIEQQHVPGVREPIGRYFREHLKASSDAAKRDITIEDLLSMRSGLESTSGRNYGAWVTSKNWVRFALARPLETSPGAEMEYSTGNTHLLSAVITAATKRSTWQYAQDVLARPLGFTLARWPQDPQGIYFGGNDMLFTPRQLVMFGELYLNRGRHGERQIVPARWVDDSLVPRGRSDFNDQMYGYGWWMREFAGEQAFFAWGFGGQYVFIIPRLQLVVVTTSSTATGEERRSHRRTIFGLLEQIITALRPAA
jgi:CubicO group peptidase (beta-lactamase class C family)